MGWITRILRWRWPQPAPIRWLAATTLFGIAFVIRWSLGPLFGAAPFVSFYPAILIAAVMFGWQEAVFVLVLSLSAGLRFFLPLDRSLLPVGWALVGGLNIAIIIGLKTLAERLAEANERQRVLFAELQHRVANTLQITAGTLERIKRTLGSDPAQYAIVDEAIQRMLASATIHRRLHDPGLFSDGLEIMLRDVVTAAIEGPAVTLDLSVEELDLSLDQKSVIAMIVMEIATNSAKHVFQRNLGARFEVAVRALAGHRAVLSIRDDGPGIIDIDDRAPSSPRLGMHILQGLADQLHGTLITEPDRGHTVTVNFPTFRPSTRKKMGRSWRMGGRKEAGQLSLAVDASQLVGGSAQPRKFSPQPKQAGIRSAVSWGSEERRGGRRR
jgi:two-component sensor histidine kinase